MIAQDKLSGPIRCSTYGFMRSKCRCRWGFSSFQIKCNAEKSIKKTCQKHDTEVVDWIRHIRILKLKMKNSAYEHMKWVIPPSDRYCWKWTDRRTKLDISTKMQPWEWRRRNKCRTELEISGLCWCGIWRSFSVWAGRWL